VAGLWFSPGTLVSFTNKTDGHTIAKILLKVALNTMTLTLKHHSTNVGFLITGTMYLIKGTCICRAMEHGILELHRCRIWYAYA
jgi:hypothetical protein